MKYKHIQTVLKKLKEEAEFQSQNSFYTLGETHGMQYVIAEIKQAIIDEQNLETLARLEGKNTP